MGWAFCGIWLKESPLRWRWLPGGLASCWHHSPCRPAVGTVVAACRAAQALPRYQRRFRGRAGRLRSVRNHRSGHGFSWLARHASARWPELSPPFSTMCRAVGTHGGAVDAQIIRQARLRRQDGEDTRPQAAPAPPVETIVDRGRRAIVRRTILPAAPHPQDMNDPADHPTIIHPSRTWLVRRQKRLNGSPSIVRKPKPCRHHVSPAKRERVNQMIQTTSIG